LFSSPVGDAGWRRSSANGHIGFDPARFRCRMLELTAVQGTA
jgi:hypothetical protein